MSDKFSKYVSDNTAFAIDWTGYLSNANNGQPDTINTSAWQVPSGITKVSDSVSGNVAIVRLSGGTAGSNYICENTITQKTSGYTVQKFISVLVIEDPIP